MNGFLTFFLGILLRIGIPVAVSAGIFLILRKLDDQWRKEAHALPVIQATQPCWDIKGCAEEQYKKCKAYQHQETPCWQLFRDNRGLLKEKCLDCQVFRLAPVPANN